ncbi:hypothetical protein GCM10025865_01270 [Paraoerskovia sediminicola]|uniref:Phage tail tape measure protein domain-containing protein n=1 Tax=Paraoerskovia sediminicola TaxID=1138587 RepID=A0ABM8FYK1_9CELL|nr:hypothetical protein [Paraoerskovia sediminicola]BDZ40828.1 hypothetical protein GCM10025865_01270 [Paraoerskovia sediminicola]
MAEIASAYVSLIPSLRGAEKAISKELGSSKVVSEGEKAGEKVGGGMSKGLSTALKIGAAAAAVVVAKGFADALGREKAADKTAAQLGLSEKQSKAAGAVAGSLYANAYGESMGDAQAAVGSVLSSIEGMSKASPKELEKVTASALDLSSAFDLDVSESARNAGILMKTGLAKDATGAFDLITASLQAVPEAMRGEVTDATQEYSDSFAALGFTGEQAMGLLVSATENGQYGVDKMGDAIKEFTIRGTDMSKTTNAAYDAIGLNSKKTANDLLAGGDRASEAFQKIVTGVQGIEDPAEQSQAALALFGTPLEDLGVNEIPKFLESLSGAETGLGDVSGAAAAMGDTLNDNLGTRLEGWKRSLETFASGAIMSVISGFEDGSSGAGGFAGVMERVGAVTRTAFDYFQTTIIPALSSTYEWVKKNAEWLGPLAAGVVATVAAYRTYIAVTKAWMVATQAARAAQIALNIAMRANPVGLIIAAVTGLVAALVWFFTKTETGRKIVATAWAGIKLAISAVTKWFVQTAWPAIKKVIDFLVLAFQVAKAAIAAAWDGVKKALSATWEWIRDNVFAKVKSGASAIGTAFETVKGVIGTAWGNVKTALNNTWTWIRDNIFAKFKTGVSAIGTAFETVKGVIKTAWDKIKSIAAKPVNFIIETVYTKGIKKVWDKIAGAVGLDSLKLPDVSPIKFASGGVLPGYTPGRDVHHFTSPTGGALSLSGGEAIMRPEFTRAVGGAAGVARLNAQARSGHAFAGGGVIDWLGERAADVGRGIVSVGKFLANPVQGIQDAISGPVNALLGAMPGGGIIRDVATALPGKIIGGLVDKVKSLISGGGASGSGPGLGGPGQAMGYKAMSGLLRGQFPGIPITSTLRPGAITASGNPSMHGVGRAVDMAPNPAYFNWIAENYPNSKQLIYSPMGGRQILDGKKFNGWDDITRSMHFNHIHWAMKNGGVLPKLYDQGGWMPHGGVGVNLTGKPEAVLTPDESRALKSGLSGRPVNVNIRTHKASPADIVYGLRLAELNDFVGSAR